MKIVTRRGKNGKGEEGYHAVLPEWCDFPLTWDQEEGRAVARAYNLAQAIGLGRSPGTRRRR